ncbi:transcription factor Spi-C [Pimephales promelas]|uniref:transcription factor Spi-C n=1 Tax=Pimephales promelas TaxID=90988 RepID=UPI0019555663|nr:transcription factor Spi-C [Pimephales promelas]KAG1953340.1 transcription factor Spi-C [Pimephales promelas]
MNSPQEYQTDLEVILEFLEEHYRQESRRKAIWNMRDLCVMSTDEVVNTSEEKQPGEEHFSNVLEEEKSQLQFSEQVMGSLAKANGSDSYTDCGINCTGPTVVDQSSVLHDAPDGRVLNAVNGPERPLTPNTTPEKCAESLPSITPAEKGKKLRLFHFLFEMLEDPGMAHCVSWVPASAGVFRFSARHKERVAELWGQRKGNRMPMTYQKMSRALRNYARSGEIIKVKKKLTYQFSVATLSTLQNQHSIKRKH